MFRYIVVDCYVQNCRDGWMGKQTNGWMDRQTGKWMDRQRRSDNQTDNWAAIRTSGQRGQADIPRDGRVNGRMDGQIDGRTRGEQTDEEKKGDRRTNGRMADKRRDG